jgi:hypothetical protein
MRAAEFKGKASKTPFGRLAFFRNVVCVASMTRSSSLVERPILRLLLMALMGLALASRLALGATMSVDGSTEGASATGPLSQLQAAIILCHTGNGHPSLPKMPHGPLLSDLLLFDQSDSAHALHSTPTGTPLLALHGAAVVFLPVHAACQPPLWRPVSPARGPPAAA